MDETQSLPETKELSALRVSFLVVAQYLKFQ